MASEGNTTEFGLMVVGDEILDGRVTDSHVDTLRALLAERHLHLLYALVLPDRRDALTAQLRWAMSRPEPFFCCGGIGSTPDDHTRYCAADAAGVAVQRHPEGEAILHRRLGADANEGRMRMIDFPAGATLIPNPVNEIPGFRIRNGHFLPGFPSMAAPMMAWVLDTCFAAGEPMSAYVLRLPGAREGDLVEMMEALLAARPGIRFSSLPRYVDGQGEVLLRIAGEPELAAAAANDLRARLTAAAVPFEEQ